MGDGTTAKKAPACPLTTSADEAEGAGGGQSEGERRGGRCVREWIFAILIGKSLDMMNRIYRRGEPYKSWLLSLQRVFYFILNIFPSGRGK